MSDLSRILKYFIPKSCPYPLIRIGGAADGGYLIPQDLENIEACFSPGVSSYKLFEDELAKKHGIRSHMCDYSSDENILKTPLVQGLQTFRKKWLDVKSNDTSLTLDEWVKDAEPNNKGDLLLQIDIEGAEYRTLLQAPKDCINRFRIIIIELHGLDKFEKIQAPFYSIKQRLKVFLSKPWMKARSKIGSFQEKSIGAKLVNFIGNKLEPYLVIELARNISKTHTCVHAHPNNCCGEFIDKKTGMNVPRVIELTFLRNDRFQGTQKSLITPTLPHPLDRANVPKKPPLILNSSWTANSHMAEK